MRGCRTLSPTSPQGKAESFNSSLSSKVIGDAPFRSSNAAPPSHVAEAHPPLNDQQQQAVRRALGSEVTYIWGPPGTGKTTVLARIAELLWLSGQRVLVVSNNNIAVDTLLEKIADRLSTCERDGLETGQAIRFGPIQKEELSEKYGPQVGLDQLVERESASLLAERDQLNERVRRLESEQAYLSTTIATREAHKNAQQRAEAARRELDASEQRAKRLSTALQDAGVRISELESDIDRASQMSFIGRAIHRLNPGRLRAELSTLKSQRSRMVYSLDELEMQIPRLRTQLAERARTANELASEVQELPSIDQGRARLSAAGSSIANARNRVKAIESKLAGIRERLVRECRILATTVYRTYLHAEIQGLFDAVIIDEASVLMLPLVYYAAGRARRRVLVTGDFRQLPPIVLTRDEEAVSWLKTDVFAKSGIEAAVSVGEEPPALVPLRRQYRMRRDICDLIDTHFYGDQLETDDSVQEESIHQVLGDGALSYVDTSDLARIIHR